MAPTPLAQLSEQLHLADALASGRVTMLEPQDLPGRYGRVVKAVDGVLEAMNCAAVVGGGWAVWRHGYIARVTQDIDIVLPADRIEEFLRVAAVSGFQVLTQPSGRWPKVLHKESDVQVDVLPEGERPGVPPDFAPTVIPSPMVLGAEGAKLRYISLAGLVELKLAAARMKDQADIVELIRNNRGAVAELRTHLAKIHSQYAKDFDSLVKQADKDETPR